jgi:hypothetical protein
MASISPTPVTMLTEPKTEVCAHASASIITPRLVALRTADRDSWVALSLDETRIIASGKTYREANSKAKSTGEGYVLTRTPKEWGPHAY